MIVEPGGSAGPTPQSAGADTVMLCFHLLLGVTGKEVVVEVGGVQWENTDQDGGAELTWK